MKIIITGGGSGGPVMPVLAVGAAIKKLKPKTEFLFVGTRKGPEKQIVEQTGVMFVAIVAAKWRRYWSLKNIFAPFIFLVSLVQAWLVVRKFRPDVIFTAGGFVGVPVAWLGKLNGSRIVMHQQDVQIGLANKLVSPFADQITTAFEYTAKQFYSGSGLLGRKLKPHAEWVGNPVREEILQPTANAKTYFHLHDDLPILLIVGGATGSAQINRLVGEILPQLVKSFQVIHQTGLGKNNLKFTDPNYHPVELIPFAEYAAILNMAHIVVCRAGLSTIAELAALGKAAIVIPMPGTHQEDNARILAYTASAVVMAGNQATAANLLKLINDLKFGPDKVKLLSTNIHRLMLTDAAEKIAKLCLQPSPNQK